MRTVGRAFVSGTFVGAVAGAAYTIGDAIVRIPVQIGKVIGSKASEIVTCGEAAGIPGNVAGTALTTKHIIISEGLFDEKNNSFVGANCRRNFRYLLCLPWFSEIEGYEKF